MSRYYEITDGTLHVGWASEDYMFTKMDERVLKGEANFDFHVGDRDAVDVVPVKHGHWVIDTKFGADVMSGGQMVTCSVCGRGIFWGRQKYCPNCGSRMDEVEE